MSGDFELSTWVSETITCTFKPVVYTVRRSVVKRTNQDLEVVELLIQLNEAKLPCCALPVLSEPQP